MATYDKNKTRPVWAVISTGTALGTCAGVIDTSAWNSMTLFCAHGGTGGSRTASVYANAGTVPGTSVTAFPDAALIGTNTSAFGGLGFWNCGSLTDQAIIVYGTSTDLSFSISYLMHD